MQFIIYSQDNDDSLPIRQANRDAHLKWLKSESPVQILAAGPWMDDENIMRGSLLIVEAEDKMAVMEWLQHDPYQKAHLPKSVTVHPYKWVIGAPENKSV